MILTPQDILSDNTSVGPKTRNLVVLAQTGLNVPPFVAIPNTHIDEVLDQPALVTKTILDTLPSASYAVRSSTLIEDGDSSSHAGQFFTHLSVKKEQIGTAIADVISQAKEKLGGNASNISVIVQEYVAADISGVTFTRNPNGNREMIVEYHTGVGEQVVSGKVTPTQQRFYWNETPNTHLPKMVEAIQIYKNIESHFDFPQDIEWCIKDDTLYILQTRPITTISKRAYADILHLESVLPKSGSFFFEKSEISEIAPRPTPFTHSLLKKIYGQAGPVRRVYAKHGISYSDTKFLRIFGNELYVDREKELQSLLPTHSFFKQKYTPSFSQLSGLFTTTKNTLFLGSFGIKPDTLDALKSQVEIDLETTTLAQAIKAFLVAYETIFEINIAAGKTLARLERVLKKGTLSVANALALPQTLFDNAKAFSLHSDALLGNSLAIEDETPFKKSTGSRTQTAPEWWRSLPEWKKKYLEKFISQALTLQHAREAGRWVVVKHTNHIRNLVLEKATSSRFSSPKHIYFATVDELLTDKAQKHTCAERKKAYDTHTKTTFPERITDSYELYAKKGPVGISAGSATGTLVDETTIQHTKGNKILYTKTLSPDLTAHFSEIVGIVSERGGLLSHLAIVAREAHIPIVSGVRIETKNISLGDTVGIDGSSGEIKKIET